MYDYGPMMNGNDWGSGWGIFMMFFWLVVLVAAVVIVMRLLRDHNHPAGGAQKADPLDIVKERYAKGEITKEQFEVLRKDLK